MDMAVITLRDALEFTQYVQPACLPPNNLKFASNKDVYCMASGWGDTAGGGAFSAIAKQLNAAVLQFFNPLECNKLWNRPQACRKSNLKRFYYIIIYINGAICELKLQYWNVSGPYKYFLVNFFS